MAAAAEHAQTPGEYIIHHLTHLGTGKPKGLVDFSVVNFDSVVFSIVLGALGCWLLWRCAKSVTSGVPGRFQAAIEFLVEMVDTQAKGIIHNETSRKAVAPLALTAFVAFSSDGSNQAGRQVDRRIPCTQSTLPQSGVGSVAKSPAPCSRSA